MNLKFEVFRYGGIPTPPVWAWRSYIVNARRNQQAVSLRLGPIAFAVTFLRYSE